MRQTCTKETPFVEGASGQWEHPQAEYLSDEYNGLTGGGDYEKYKCPICGKVFYETLPD